MTGAFLWGLLAGAVGAVVGTLVVVGLDCLIGPFGLPAAIVLSAPFGIGATLLGWSYGLDRSDL